MEKKDERTLIQKGWDWYRNGWYAEAARCFAEAAALYPGSSEAHLCLGCAYAAQGQAAPALHSFEQAAGLDLTSADPHVAMARVHAGLGDRESARAALEVGCRVSVNEESSGHQIAHGSLAYLTGDNPKAESHFRRVLEGHPDDAFLLCALASVLLRQNKNTEARDLLRRVVPLPFSTADDSYNLGLAEERLGNKRAAAAAYRRALNKDPDHLPARSALAWVEFRRFRWWSAGRHAVRTGKKRIDRRSRGQAAPASDGECRQGTGAVA